VRQTAYADVFLPPDEEQRRDGVGTAVENSDIEKLGISAVAIGATRLQQRGSVEQRLSLNWQNEEQSPQGAPSTTNRALTAHGWLDLAPRGRSARSGRGPRCSCRLAAAASNCFPIRTSCVPTCATARGFRSVPTMHCFCAANSGATLAPSSAGIPQDFLFRTGGSNSVRGYAVSKPRRQEGSAIVGGRYLVTMSGEYTHWLNPTWGAAVFVDAGNAVDDWQAMNLAVGYGVGARWRSPAGPLGIDLAYGQRDGKLRLDFSLAIPF
jgi:translocation and assembly module TamA